MSLNAIVLKLVPSSPTRTDLMCFSPTILLLTVFKSSIINFGSGLPEPKGARTLTLLKNHIIQIIMVVVVRRDDLRHYPPIIDTFLHARMGIRVGNGKHLPPQKVLRSLKVYILVQYHHHLQF